MNSWGRKESPCLITDSSSTNAWDGFRVYDYEYFGYYLYMHLLYFTMIRYA